MSARSLRSAAPTFKHPNPSRLHALLVLLQAGDAVHAGQAADLLGVSRRTIARDLKFLREDIGLDIDFDQGARSYQLAQDGSASADGSPSHSALAAFIIARHALAALGTNTADRDTMAAATERLSAALPPTLRIERPTEPDALPPALSFDQIVTLHQAIQQRHQVAIRRPGAPRAEQTLVPRALLSHQGRWWAVVEEDEGPAAFGFVPLDRTSEILDRGAASSPPPPLDLDALIAAHPIICETAGHRAFHLSLTDEGAEHCARAAPPFQHRLAEAEHGADLFVCAASADAVARWSLSLGTRFETQDADLRAAVVRMAEEIAAHHR